eukprot:6851219-Ditylum_brightwellii.AAC.1
MEIVKFGMKSALIRFRDKYYKYNGLEGKDNVCDKDIRLDIGGYKSAFLANIVVSYLFEMTNAHFAKAITRGIYHDDGLVVFKGCQTPRQIRQWLKRFQQSINNITGGTYLQFTTEVWNLPMQSKRQVSA